MKKSWSEHYEKTNAQTLAIAETLAIALKHFESERRAPGKAIDLGCGTGIDTLELLRRGWHVIAVDREREVLKKLDEIVQPDMKHRLELKVCLFSEVIIPPAMLVNASFAVPFCEPDRFPVLWNKIRNAILPGGRFAGHFFGVNDSWSSDRQMTFQSKREMGILFDGFTFDHFEEIERNGKALGGAQKHWHVFHVVATKAQNKIMKPSSTL